jgi:low molecular weight protein-tyrosine phosphatase
VSGDRFELVFVCTANRFRSPIAAELARRATADLPVDVGSYGTLDRDPAPVLPQALGLGLDLAEHRSRPIRGARLADADLVLGFERVHVATAVVDAGAPRDRAFGLTELVALLDASPQDGDVVARARARIARAATRRGGDWPELADPAGGPERGYARSARDLERLVGTLVERLFA